MKDVEGKVRRTRNLKRFVAVGVVFLVLVWGSSFLISTIDRFLTTLETKSYNDIHFHVQELELELNEAIYATPSNRPTEFGDKVPLNKKIFDEHVLSAKLHDIQWIKSPSSIQDDRGTYVIKNEKKDDDFEVVIKSVADEEYNQVLIEKSHFEYNGASYKVEDFVASPDLKKVVLKTNVTSQWRHSSVGYYWILDVATQKVKPVFDEKISTISWSPDSSKVAFIFNNNIYLRDISLDEALQVTDDGSAEIFNGKPDWVYEEEVFASDIVLWWSPTGDKFAFLKSNNSEVPEFIIPFYAQNKFEDYPEIVKIKYPKAGYPNPIVDIWTYDLKEGKTKKHDLKSKNIGLTERLITEVVWVGEEVLVKTSNRASDLLEVYLVGEEAKSVRSHTADKSWFEITSHTLFVPKNKTAGRQKDGYIDTVVENGFNHLAYFSPPDSSKYELLTSGNWEVVNGVGAFDFNTNTIYFTSTMKSSIERHIHSINLFDRSDDGLPYIKDITVKEGYYSSSFSSGGRFLFLSVLGPDVPKQQINDLRMEKKVKIIEDNSELIEKLRKYVVPEVKHSTVELKDDESGETFLANAAEVLPLNFDKKKKYPVLFQIYGGPGSQMVDKKWAISFNSLVAAELDAIVVTVDGRGTGYNNLNSKLGSNYKFIVRDQLGKYEPRDLISAANIWAEKPYVDRERIAIWGWSYGGFLTLKTIETDTKDPIFNYGVAIAPVTKWKLYDSIYTERYLRTPKENPLGYETGSIHNATNFKHAKKFFIGHGSGDDNVHVQHSLQLLDEFNLAEVENFEFMIFPDSNHGMTYHNGQKVVYDRILDFFKRAFNYELE